MRGSSAVSLFFSTGIFIPQNFQNFKILMRQKRADPKLHAFEEEYYFLNRCFWVSCFLPGDRLGRKHLAASFQCPAVNRRDPKQPAGALIKPCKQWDFNYQPQLVDARFLNHQQYHQLAGRAMHLVVDAIRTNAVSGRPWLLVA